jgi:serine/threonine-protein kinase
VAVFLPRRVLNANFAAIMPDERWEKIKNLYDQALEMDSGARRQFLADACGQDEELRREIDSLLDANEKNDYFLEKVVGHAAADLIANPPASALPGRIGPYEIRSSLGEGGMGIVYRARDTILKRDVALKLLPPQFAQDNERLLRFQREAEVLASLNHPNVAQIYGLEGTGVSRCIVMELVDGETLQQRLKRGPIPIEETLQIAKQIAEALEAAHEKGVVHRDLKPANVKVTPDGKVKVLDFGLAKALAEETRASDLQNAPTEGASPTIQGVILGTAAYMSPEQARGKTVDKRTDIWGFGCVLYELLTGKRAFYGEDTNEPLAAVLKGEPDWTALPPGTPPSIRVLLRRCLQRDMARRLRDATDARIEIEDALAVPAAVSPAAPASITTPTWRRMLPTAAMVFLSVVAGIVAWNLKPPPVPDARPVSRLMVALPPNTTFVGGTDSGIALSADGTHLAYVASAKGAPPQVYVRALDAPDASPLTGTEGAFSPFFSPDGQWIGFFSAGKLKKISVNGGAALTLCNVAGANGGSWGRNDTIVFSPTPTSGLFVVSAAGGEPKPFTTLQPGNISHRWPQFLPDGKTVVFTIVLASARATGGIADDSEIAVQQLNSTEHKVLIRGGTSPRYASTGHLLYYRAGTIMAVSFDAERLEMTGQQTPVMETVLGDPNGGVAQFSVSNLGSLTYVSGGPQSANLNLVWVDRHGIAQPLAAPPRAYRAPRLSPDGRRVAVGIDADVWIYDISRDTLTRFTFDGINAANAAV